VSRSWQEVVTEVRTLNDARYNEVVLTGINIGLYEGGLTRLVERVLSHTSIQRLRISSIEPWTVEDSLISILKDNPRLCKHLHLPMQHGSDPILRAMGRPYTASYFHSLIDRIRNAAPEAAIGLDIIVGFPGEDEKSFDESYSLIEDLHVTYLHVFPFSPRQGTAAALLPGRPDEAVTKQRSSNLRALSREKRHAFACSRQGMVEEVLVTGICEGHFYGVTSNYLTVHAQGSVLAGNIVSVLLKDMEGQTVTGELLG
jgi:threonylcarbamoyladenosine tRNA methylthiotransferase MtaB